MKDIEELIRREIFRINSHLPCRRVSLLFLLSEENPHVVLRNGDVHYFKKYELELLATLSENPGSLLLPIFLELSLDYRGYFIVRGKEECRIILQILGKDCEMLDGNTILCPRYLLPRLRRQLPTTTTYVFTGEST